MARPYADGEMSISVCIPAPVVFILVSLALGLFGERIFMAAARLSYWHRVAFVALVYVLGIVVGGWRT